MSTSQALANPAAAGVASQAILQSEAKEQQRQTLQALIEAAAVTDPTITQRVTVAAVWQYFRLPDDSFGWAGKKRDDGTRPPMPTAAKGLCILTTLSLGLMPGVGHVLWLGNKAYATADARRYKANGDRDLRYVGKRIVRPFSDGEKEMFGVEPGDMHCVIEQKVRFKGEEAEWVGYGLIGKHELDWRDKYGNMKAGMQSKKDCAMHLITRAERDMLNRFYPLGGLPDAPDDLHAYEESLEPQRTLDVAAQPSLSAASLEAFETGKARGEAYAEARARLSDLMTQVAAAGGAVGEILGDENLLESGATDDLNDAGDVLEAWVAENAAASTAPTPTPTAAAADAAEPPKRGRGRPKKTDKPATDPATVTPPSVGQALAAAEADADEAPALAEAPEDFEAGDAFEPAPPPREDPLALPYTGTAEQKAHLRAAADQAGFKADSDLWALAGAMKGRPMLDLDKVLEAFKTSRASGPAKPAAASTPPPAAARPAPTADALAKSSARLRASLERVAKLDGAPLKILGQNPHNALERGNPAEMEALADELDKWSPPAAKAATPVAAAATPPPAAVSTLAHNMINKALGGDLPEAVKARLRDLASRELKAGDHLHLPRAIREGKDGNFREFDELIGARPLRR